MRKLIVLLALLSIGAAPTTSPSTQDSEEAVRLAIKSAGYDASISPHLKALTATSGHLLVAARVNGKDAGWFIFDTGAGMSCIDKSVADELKLADAGAITARGMGGDRESKLRKFDSLSVGPVSIHDGVLLELNLKPYGLVMGAPIAGIIGHECFDAGVFDVDLANGTIDALDAKTYKLGMEFGSWHEMKVINRLPTVIGTIEGGPPGPMTLDTGANEAVLVHSGTVASQKLLDGRKTRLAFNGGVGGIKSVRHGLLKALTIAGSALENIDASFAQPGEGLGSSDETLATVGIDLLSKFRIILDQSHDRIAMKRIAREKNPPTKPATTPTR